MPRPVPLEEVIDQTQERLLLHASKVELTISQKTAYAVLSAIGGQRVSNAKKKGELFITDKSITLARWVGLFKKKIGIELFAIYNTEEAEDLIMGTVTGDKEKLSKMEEKWKNLSMWERIKTSYFRGETGKEYHELVSNRLKSLYLVTSVEGGKGIFKKGFNAKLVNFNIGTTSLKTSASGGILGGFSNWTRKPRETIYIWKFRIVKLAPESRGFEEGAMERIVQNMKIDSDRLEMQVDRLWEMAKSAYAS